MSGLVIYATSIFDAAIVDPCNTQYSLIRLALSLAYLIGFIEDSWQKASVPVGGADDEAGVRLIVIVGVRRPARAYARPNLRAETMKTVMLALIVTYTLGQGARAESTAPSPLAIGYDDEGKVDPSSQACLAHVQEVTTWEKAELERGAKDVCAARKRHADAYAALQSNYKAFVKAFSEDRRLNLSEAVSNLKALIKACMDHKFGITTGGHNIMIDIIENDIRAGCLTLGGNLIKDETKRFTKALVQGGFVP